MSAHVCGWAEVDGVWICIQDHYAAGHVPGSGCVRTWELSTGTSRPRVRPEHRPTLPARCYTCGRPSTGTYSDGSPRYDHGHTPDGMTWVDTSRRGGHALGAVRRCPSCDHDHAAGTTCQACPECEPDLRAAARRIFDLAEAVSAEDARHLPGSTIAVSFTRREVRP